MCGRKIQRYSCYDPKTQHGVYYTYRGMCAFRCPLRPYCRAAPICAEESIPHPCRDCVEARRRRPHQPDLGMKQVVLAIGDHAARKTG